MSTTIVTTGKRPGTLTAMLAAVAVGAIAAIISAIHTYGSGKELAREIFAKELGQEADGLAKSLMGSLYETQVASAYETLSARAGFGLFFAIGLILFGLLARNAATWARVLITLFAVFGALAQVMTLGDPGSPSLLSGLSAVSMAAWLAAAVLCWLPGNNRFAKAHKAMR
ncbi:hypothetical protein NLX83_00065 [Allokutzneria sp. A3M-2-11 16]|uniref:hypothetical protein n=1 Tax=Allokutzneria sp. A3M-2-11 16 TaxID=2962043 RepID=UPI0020B72B6E|nr:hypothetical protein [Allokutzneria sp. A3M-2-11 16]MCP3797641.1 hypothetical protein [Allokutzneria sp. A3M-2-11 16]